jgi:hypothetical protein
MRLSAALSLHLPAYRKQSDFWASCPELCVATWHTSAVLVSLTIILSLSFQSVSPQCNFYSPPRPSGSNLFLFSSPLSLVFIFSHLPFLAFLLPFLSFLLHLFFTFISQFFMCISRYSSLTDSVELSCCSEANSNTATQEMLRLSSNPKGHYRFPNSPTVHIHVDAFLAHFSYFEK